MRLSILLFVAGLAREVACSRYPELQWDPETAEDCVEWYNNGDGETCEFVRSYFGITPEQFTKWNPSVSLDCQPWRYQSYCIVTLGRLNDTAPTTISSTTVSSTTTTSAATLGPSPTSWTEMGCYVQNSERSILEQNMSPAGGDASLTIPKCKNSCYRRAYRFAGVQDGKTCWCSSYVGGEWAKDQADCNTPCTGDKNTFCGGQGLLNIFKAQTNQAVATSTTSTMKSAATASSGGQTGAAAKIKLMFAKG